MLSRVAVAADYEKAVKDLAKKDTPEYSKALGDLLTANGSPDSLKALQHGLESTDDNVLLTVIRLANRLHLRDPITFQALAHICRRQPKKDIRVPACSLAAHFDQSDSAEGLVGEMLKDNDPDVRQEAQWAVVFHRGRAAIPALPQALKDPDAAVRIRAAWHLSELGDDSGRQLALSALEGTKWDIQYQAIEALGILGRSEDLDHIEHLTNIDRENSAIVMALYLAHNHGKLRGKMVSEKAAVIFENMTDLNSDAGVWAQKESMILMTTDRAAFILEAKRIAKKIDAAGLSARQFIHDEDLN